MKKNIKTIKDAHAHDLLMADEWTSMRLERHCKEAYKAYAPLLGAVGEEVKGKVFFSSTEVEEIISKTEAKRRGGRIKAGAEPYTKMCFNPGKSIRFGVYRLSDTIFVG